MTDEESAKTTTKKPPLQVLDITQAREMIQLASPGPWEAVKSWPGQSFVERVQDADGVLVSHSYPGEQSPMAHTFDGPAVSKGRAQRNAQFIAFARTALRIATAEIERLRAVVEEARSLRDRYSGPQAHELMSSGALFSLFAALDAYKDGSLGVWSDGTDTVVAFDHLDVFRVLREHHGSVESELDAFERRDDDHVLRINDPDNASADAEGKVSRTCREWIAWNGRGFLCSTEY